MKYEDDSTEILVHDKAVVDQMHEELIALVNAWSDRGIPPSDTAQFLAAVSHVMLLRLTECSLGQLISLLVRQWERHNGKL